MCIRDRCRNRARVRVKNVLEKLGRVCGWDALTEVVPEESSALVAYVKARYERGKRKKRQGKEGSGEEDGDSDSSESDGADADVGVFVTADKRGEPRARGAGTSAGGSRMVIEETAGGPDVAAGRKRRRGVLVRFTFR